MSVRPTSVNAAPRVALISVGMGRVQRGFERYFADLFDVLKESVALTLFKSAGATGPHERVPTGLRLVTALVRRLPGRWWGRTPYHRDCLAFALCLLPALRAGRFELVHCIDPPLAAVLGRLREHGLMQTPLLFTEGSLMPAPYYPSVSHIHHVGQAALTAAVTSGVPASHMTLVPCGVHAHRFPPAAPATREALRRQHGVAPGCLVILVVSARMRSHKRVDHLIEEVARLLPQTPPDELLLWLDGHPEEAAIDALARSRLGARCRISHVGSDAVTELYQLADLLVHGALEESFGLVIVEAMCSGLPVLVHDSPHFHWLVGEDGQTVDMAQPGALASRLREWRRLAPADRPRPDVGRVRARFDWVTLKPDYAALYRRTIHGTTRLQNVCASQP
jgi:glycosyltransferase involved in cell wall biosynthesis